MAITNPINKYDTYLKRMEKGIEQKAFFLDRLGGFKAVLDYGCANGALITYLMMKRPNVKYYGYDNNPEMVQRAKKNIQDFIDEHSLAGIEWFVSDNLDEIMTQIKTEETVLNLSSVLHEIYAYCTEPEIQDFWNFVNSHKFFAITIRDMFPATMHGESLPALTKNNFALTIMSNIQLQKQLNDYVANWGIIGDWTNLLHFLLKYKYLDNWEREVKERYFFMSSYNFEDMMNKWGYYKKHSRHFNLPHMVKNINDDFGISIATRPTHSEFIFTKK